MLLVITEHNSWENESWKYLLDLDKQDGEALNDLMIFIRLANEYHEEVKKSVTHRLFAASKYSFKFYNKIDTSGKYPRLINNKIGGGLIVTSNPGYHSHSFNLDNKLSSKRMRSAMLAIRDKKDNILYKNFDSLFLKSKRVSQNEK